MGLGHCKFIPQAHQYRSETLLLIRLATHPVIMLTINLTESRIPW